MSNVEIRAMTQLIKGSQLNQNQREQVLRAFVHRHTAIPEFYADDQDWLEKHAFYINKNGMLSNHHKHCEPSYLAE